MHDFVFYALMFTVVSLGIASVTLFRFILPHTQQHQRSIKYFIGFFVCASLAFIAFSFTDNSMVLNEQTQHQSSIALFFNTLLYTVSLLSLRHGLVVRKNEAAPELWTQPFCYIHIVIACTIQLIMFNYFPQYHPYRISLFNAQLLFIFVSCRPYVSGDMFGEKMMRYTVYIVAGSMVLMSIPLFFEATYEYYNVSVMSMQSLNYHVWMGMLFILLLADSIEMHYRNSITDTLTGLHNRRFFMDNIHELQAQASADSFASMIVCDIDYFKRINDTYGHDVGDCVIRQFAQVLDKETRDDDVLARIGGEEFAVFLPNTPVVIAEQVAQRMRTAMQALVIKSHDGKTVATTASFGVASLFGQVSPSDFINAADHAMYAAKNAGRNCVHVADTS